MAAEGPDDMKPVAEEHVEGGKDAEDETKGRVESAKRLVEEAKKSVEDLMKSVPGEANEPADKESVDVNSAEGEASGPSIADGESVDNKSAEGGASGPSIGDGESVDNKSADGETSGPSTTGTYPEDESEQDQPKPPPRNRPATPIPFSRSSDGTQTPVSQTPYTLPRTPPPLSTRSLPRASADGGPKTPSDMSGLWTPSSPRTPVNVSSADSIRRKPVPAPSKDNLREGSVTPRNPLEKTLVTITPERLGEKAPSTPDSTPRTHISLPRKKKRIGWRKVGRLWWVEGAWCSVSLLCIIIIFAVLSAFDNHPVSTLPLNLPALIAFFATAATVSLAVPASECISQWKWNHLRADTRSLSDFQLFDSASRSPLGAAALLLKLRHTHVARVGAVVLLLSLSAPAVTQVAVGYREGAGPGGGGGDASVSATRVLEGSIEGLGTAVEDGVGGNVQLSLPVACHTGQCDFEPFAALGICSGVHDVSDKVTAKRSSRGRGNSTGDSPYNVSLPEEANCHFVTGQPRNVMTCKTDGSATLSFDGDVADAAIYSMPVIYSNPEGEGDDDADAGFEALEVLFYLCQAEYAASVRDAQPAFKMEKSSAVLAGGSDDRDVDVECDIPTREGSDGAVECKSGDVPSDAFMKLEDGDVEVSAQFRALGEVAVAIGEGLVGLWMRDGDDEASVVGTPRMEDISRVVYGGAAGEQKERVERMAESIATSLTNAISAKQATDDTPPNILAVTGTSLQSQTLIAINYAALSVLLALSLTSLAFLVLTAVLTERDAGAEVLKGSALAALFALEEECRGVAGGLESVESMGRKARAMHVRLRDEAIVLAGEGEGREKPGDV